MRLAVEVKSDRSEKPQLAREPVPARSAQRESVYWAAAAVLGAFAAWDARHGMNADGISYLEIAEAYSNGDWARAVNGYWSPLYSWLIAGSLALFRPSPAQEFVILHVINYGIYLLALATFAYFCRGMNLQQPAWLFFAYTIFSWVSLALNSPLLVTPDLLMSALVYLVAGLTLRGGAAASWSRWALLGFTLGLGYLSKAPMFPLSLLLLVLLALSGYKLPRVLVAAFAFILTAGPFLVALSSIKERFTFGEAAPNNYAWFVNGVTRYAGWTGEPAGSGTPVHPPQKLYDSPSVLLYDGFPYPATFPAWYDPSYWHEGLQVRFNLGEQIRAISTNLMYLKRILLAYPVLVAGLLVLAMFGARWRTFLVLQMIWAFGGVAMLVLVYLEARHIAPFLALLLLGGYGGFMNDHRVKVVLCVVGLGIALTVLAPLPGQLARAALDVSGRGRLPEYLEAAAAAQPMGLQPGDRIAAVGGDSFDLYFARTARLRVPALLPGSEAPKFWNLDEAEQQRLFGRATEVGVRAFAACDIPPGHRGWTRLGGTNCYVKLLPFAN